MKRKKLSWMVFWVNGVLFWCCGEVGGSPTAAAANNIAIDNFQTGLQQQNFCTTLTSIEERLRSLDNIYSMQLSQTLENKLDQYSRRLESLDTKIIRLEALVMLNLDKISENISTKNFKDDVTKTNTMRKIDSVYEGISHRLSYMDRKYETNFAKVQSKMDSTLTRLEKIEENMAAKESDIEGELSDAIFAIDDLKTTYNAMEGRLLNITTSTLNNTKDNYNFLKEMYVDNKNSLNKLHDNIIANLEYIDNKTLVHFKATEDNNLMLKTMRIELKEDFNEYANKVADMNSYIWKNSDTTEEDLKVIAAVVNSTKTEVQNGVRSLMLQIGKLSGKDNIVGVNGISDINKKLSTNFEKILSNQDLFLESCHRLQMDESQIESEISDMLEKLIDMLEKKIASEMKDIKNLEKTLKNHDGRVNRNLYQANTNTISLFEKFTMHSEETKTEMTKIGNDLNSLFAFIQNISPSVDSTDDTKAILDKLNEISEISKKPAQPSDIQNTRSIQNMARKIDTVHKVLQKLSSELNTTLNQQNFENILTRTVSKYLGSSCNETEIITSNKTEIDQDTMKTILEIFGPNPNLSKDTLKSQEIPDIKNKCKQNYGDLIDIRHGGELCENDGEKVGKMKKKKGRERPYQIDIRGGLSTNDDTEDGDYEGSSEDTTQNVENGTDEIDTITETAADESTYSFLTDKPNTTDNVI